MNPHPVSHDWLIVFARWPEPGKTKTRLIGALGAQGASDLQKAMTRHALGWAAAWAEAHHGHVVVQHAGGSATQMQNMFGRRFAYAPQTEGNLGHRMAVAMAEAFDQGAGRVVLIGTDCPGLNHKTISQAFELLGSNDLVLAPASDGGYVLIGTPQPQPVLFDGPDWGSDTVFVQTQTIAEQNNLSIAMLPVHHDVDRPEDLPVWHTARRSPPPQQFPTLSVIVPTLNESSALPKTLQAIRAAGHVELIVADGGSDDQTCPIAESFGAKVIEGPRGRAAQLNAGAANATGELLLFCHADTQLPQDYDQHVRQTLCQPNTIAGAFEFKIDLPGSGPRRIERGVQKRCRKKQLPYGDQGIFMRAEDFERLGRFPAQPIMEDYELMRRVRRHGRIAIAPAPALTSGRYWQACGLWQTTLINGMTVAGYRLGLPHRWLQRFRSGWLKRAAGRESHAS